MIYHICNKSEWNLANSAGVYAPESLAIEGFIHCSTDQQFEAVANFYFKGQKNLVALAIDDKRVGETLKWDEVGAQKFPHIYGELKVSAVDKVADLTLNDEGIFIFPFKPILH